MALRDGPFSEIKVPLTWAAGAAVAIAAAATIFFLLSDRRESLETQAYSQVQATADKIQAPVGAALSAPVRWTRAAIDGVRSFFLAVSENPRLREENKRIPVLEAQLARERDINERLAAILGLRTDPPIPMVTGLAITDARGPFANARLVNVGREAGVKVGNPVMSEFGLVGRVVGVADGVSRVLLLNDVASRTPVMIDRTNARAILTGDGGAYPRLANMRSREAPRVGDVLVTSGDGGVFPRGLPVGVVVKGVDGAWRAQLASDRAPIDYVRILKFEDFTQIVDEKALSAPVAPSQMGGAVPQPSVRAPIAAPKAGPTAGALPKSVTVTTAQPKAAASTPPAPKTPAAAAPALKAGQPQAAQPRAAQPATSQPKAPTVTQPAPKAAAPAAPAPAPSEPAQADQ